MRSETSRSRIGLALASVGALAASTALALPGGSAALPIPAPKPKPPIAYAGYVEQITSSTAVLKARIDPQGSATEYYFQYGPTTAYGSQTPSAPAGNGTQEVKLSQPVNGLQPYTTYHFRVLASSSAGTTDSTDATFTTKAIPLSLTASATPNPVVFGSPLKLTGTLSGTGNAGVDVVVQANSFPYTNGFHNITSPAPTGPTGSFSFPIAGLLESTRLRVAVATTGKPAVVSPAIVELVTVRVTLHVRPTGHPGYVRFYGTVTPPQHGAQIAFEHFSHGHYVVIAGSRITVLTGGPSHFKHTLRLRGHGRYRVLVEVVAGGAVVSGHSRPVLIR
jgi:hypothetical protein